jgi:hypothetical protein
MTAHPAAPAMTQHVADPLPTPAGIWLGVCGAPLAWGAQVLIGWWISGQTCADGTPEWGSWAASQVRMLLIVISAVALVIAIAGIVSARRQWRARRTGNEPVEVFTGAHRPAFMALAGMLVSSVLGVAILLTGIALSSVSVCEYMR